MTPNLNFRTLWIILAGFSAFGAAVGALYHDPVCLVLNLGFLAFDIYMVERQ